MLDLDQIKRENAERKARQKREQQNPWQSVLTYPDTAPATIDALIAEVERLKEAVDTQKQLAKIEQLRRFEYETDVKRLTGENRQLRDQLDDMRGRMRERSERR